MNRTITKNFRLGKKGKRKIQIGINFTIEIGMEDRVFTRGRTVIDSVTDQRNSSANWEGKILPAWKTRPMCLHGLLFNLIGLLGEKLCTEPLPVEGKLFYKRTSRHRHLSYLHHLLLSPSHSTESKRGTDFSVETISNTHPGVFFVGKLGQSCSSAEIKLDIQLSRVAALLLSVLFDLLTDSHNRAFSISKEEKKRGRKIDLNII